MCRTNRPPAAWPRLRGSWWKGNTVSQLALAVSTVSLAVAFAERAFFPVDGGTPRSTGLFIVSLFYFLLAVGEQGMNWKADREAGSD